MPRKPNAIPKKQEKSTSKIIEEKIEKEKEHKKRGRKPNSVHTIPIQLMFVIF